MDDQPAKRPKAEPHENNTSPRPAGRFARFCILNDQLFEHILSFLGNQTLVKLQGITGDVYPTCEQALAELCCSCENDEPAIVAGLCSRCEEERNPFFRKLIGLVEARLLYGHNLSDVPRRSGGEGHVVARVDAEAFMLKECGSKIEWLKVIARQDQDDRKLAARKIQNQTDYEVLVRSLPRECAAYVITPGRTYNVVALKERAGRYTVISAALEARGLKLREDSQLCRQYIMKGTGNADDIVDTMEEAGFLQNHTDYWKRCSAKRDCFKGFLSYRGGLGWGDESDESTFGTLGEADCGAYFLADASTKEQHQHIRENTTKELCVEFLQDSRGLILPRIWEACRKRYNFVLSVGANPKQYMNHIYTGTGKPPQAQN